MINTTPCCCYGQINAVVNENFLYKFGEHRQPVKRLIKGLRPFKGKLWLFPGKIKKINLAVHVRNPWRIKITNYNIGPACLGALFPELFNTGNGLDGIHVRIIIAGTFCGKKTDTSGVLAIQAQGYLPVHKGKAVGSFKGAFNLIVNGGKFKISSKIRIWNIDFLFF